MKRTLLVSLIFIAVLGAIFSFLAFRGIISPRDQSSSAVGSQPHEPAPDFALETLAGTVLRLSDLRGRKIILNFWASWCTPCRVEMPDFERVHQEYGDRLAILGINIREDRQTIERFLSSVTVSYPILLDPHGAVVRAYRVLAQPATYWLDEQGRIVERKFGAYTRAELEERVREFARPSLTAPPTDIATTSSAEPALKRGNLFEKYFSQYDLESLQIEGDPSQVAYVADLDLSLLGLGCPSRDCIPSIDQPQFETPTEANSWLKPTDLVASVTYNGVTKAYPVKILNWHEIVNDDFNGVPLAVTYCPLCHSSLVFIRPTIAGRILEFGVSGRLYKSDLVMYDRQTGSFWSQIEGRAIIGPLAGKRLEYVPAEMMTWQKWQELYSVAWVLARPTLQTAVGGQPNRSQLQEPQASWRGRRPQIVDPSGATLSQDFLRDYDFDPYSWYKADNTNTFGTPFADERLPAKTTIWGIELNGAAKAYVPESVATWGALNDELGGRPILVLWDPQRQVVKFFARRLSDRTLTFNRRDGQIIDAETQSVWNTDGQAESGPLEGTQLRQLPGISAFWFAWLAFHLKTELYH